MQQCDSEESVGRHLVGHAVTQHTVYEIGDSCDHSSSPSHTLSFSFYHFLSLSLFLSLTLSLSLSHTLSLSVSLSISLAHMSIQAIKYPNINQQKAPLSTNEQYSFSPLEEDEDAAFLCRPLPNSRASR